MSFDFKKSQENFSFTASGKLLLHLEPVYMEASYPGKQADSVAETN